MLPSKDFSNCHKEASIAVLIGICGVLPFMCKSGLANLFSFMSDVLIFISFLSYGKRSGLISSGISLLVVAVFCEHNVLFEVSCGSVLPSMLMGYCSLLSIEKKGKIWWYPESLILRNLFFLSILLLVLLSLTSYSENAMARNMEEVENFVKSLMPRNVSPDVQVTVLTIKQFWKYVAGFFVLFNMIGVIFNFIIAESICRYFGVAIRPKIKLHDISISPLLSVFPLVAMTMSYIFDGISYICCGLAIVSLMSPFMAGLSIIHFFANRRKNYRSVLAIFYLLLFLATPLVILFILLLGIVDSFYAIRPMIK